MKNQINGNFKTLLLIFLLSFILRLAVAIYYYNFDEHALASQDRKPFLFGSYTTSQIIEDIDRYNSTAKNILDYRRIVQSNTRIPSVPPPIYPIFLSFFYWLFGYNIFSFLIPQISIAAISSILVFLLTQYLFNNKKISVMASLFYACNPHFILIAIQPYSEPLYLFLLLSLFFSFKNMLLKTTLKNSVIAGLFMGLATLCRTVFLVFIPFIFIWLFSVFLNQKRKLVIAMLGVFLPLCLLSGLWAIRNYKVFNRVLFSINYRSFRTGIKLWEYDPSESYLKRYKYLPLALINWVKDNPGIYLKFCKERFVTFLFEAYPQGVSNRNKIVSSLIFYTVFPLGYLGILREVRKKNKLAILILLYILSTTLLHILTIVDGELRHRLPIELFMGIFASFAISFRAIKLP